MRTYIIREIIEDTSLEDAKKGRTEIFNKIHGNAKIFQIHFMKAIIWFYEEGLVKH